MTLSNRTEPLPIASFEPSGCGKKIHANFLYERKASESLVYMTSKENHNEFSVILINLDMEPQYEGYKT